MEFTAQMARDLQKATLEAQAAEQIVKIVNRIKETCKTDRKSFMISPTNVNHITKSRLEAAGYSVKLTKGDHCPDYEISWE